MNFYTAYILGDDHRFRDFKTFPARDDEAALAQARLLVDGCMVEVGQFERKVASLQSKD